MNFYKKLHRTIALLIILLSSFCIYSMEKVPGQVECIGNTTILTEIAICDESGCTKRTVWMPHNIDTLHVYQVPNATLASEKIHQRIAQYQKNLNLTECPFLVYEQYNIYQLNQSPGSFESFKNSKTDELYGIRIKMDPRIKGNVFNFVAGHELAHLTTECNQSQLANLNKKHNQYKNIARYGFIFGILTECIGLLGIILFPHKTQAYKSLFATGMSIGFGSYALGYYKGNTYSKELQNIEFSCDRISVNLGKNPEKRIKLAKAGQEFFSMCEHNVVLENQSPDEKQTSKKIPKVSYSWKNYMDRYMPFPSSHPSSIDRIIALQKLIDEQKALLLHKSNEI